MAEHKLSHSFGALDQKEQKEQKDNSQNNSTAIVVIGKTGAGKSSLIHLFCNGAKVGHNTNSATTSSHLFGENKSRYWLDSQGASDSNGVSDDKVLCDVLEALYCQNISKFKIIWCVSGDTQSRANAEFQKQARFIKDGLGDKNNGIWRSCLIIKKQGDPKPRTGLDGLLAAASISGSDIKYGDNRLFGYSFYDENVSLADHTLNAALEYITDPTKRAEFLKRAGFWAKGDIKTELNKLLSKIPTSSITFTIKKCTKCGSIGDPRFVHAPCHVASEKHHPGDLTAYHPNPDPIKYHPATPQSYHPQTITNFHPGSCNEKRYYHPGSRKSVYYHPKGSYWNLFQNHDSKWRYKCCDRWNWKKNDGIDKEYGCTLAHTVYTCCNYSDSSSGCSSYYVYSCCGGSSSSSGCKTGFGCCHRETTDRGCSQEYGCCNKSIHDTGCLEKYSCCNAPSGHKGCKMKYPCCDKEPDQEGCIERCSNASCHIEWGQGPGCIGTSSK